MSSLLSASDFKDRKEVIFYLDGAEAMVEKVKESGYPAPIRGKVLIQMKEASSRTGGSFEEAAAQLGFRTREIQGKDQTSQVKGESPFDDVITHANQQMNVYITRTKVEGEARYLAEKLQTSPALIDRKRKISVINGGDGERDHVSQTFLDIYTIRQKLRRLDNYTIGFVGDLRYGRTVHSFVQLLKLFKGIKVILVSFGGLKLPDRYKKGLNIIDEVDGDLNPLRQCDIIYATRIQRERLVQDIDYDRIVRNYVIDKAFLDRCKDSVLVMHPQPVVFEIAPDIREDRRLVMDDEALNGLFVRMFIIENAFGDYQPLDLSIPKENLVRESHQVEADKAKKRGKYFEPVKKGTVIDHLDPGSIWYLVPLLVKMGFDIDLPHLMAGKMKTQTPLEGRKDIILLYAQYLEDQAAGVLSLVSPNVTFNVLQGDGMMHKYRYRPPHHIQGVFHCPNPWCITNHDRYARSWFTLENGTLICHYCEREFRTSEVLIKTITEATLWQVMLKDMMKRERD